jgi:hypothetical protein
MFIATTEVVDTNVTQITIPVQACTGIVILTLITQANASSKSLNDLCVVLSATKACSFHSGIHMLVQNNQSYC